MNGNTGLSEKRRGGSIDNNSTKRKLHKGGYSPLPTITTSSNKQALVTLLDGFDIKMRFLEPEELASITGFPDGYFDKAPTKKQKVWLIGNAVPTIMSQRLIETLMD